MNSSGAFMFLLGQGQILDKFCPRPEVEPYEQLQVSHSVGAGNKL